MGIIFGKQQGTSWLLWLLSAEVFRMVRGLHWIKLDSSKQNRTALNWFDWARWNNRGSVHTSASCLLLRRFSLSLDLLSDEPLLLLKLPGSLLSQTDYLVGTNKNAKLKCAQTDLLVLVTSYSLVKLWIDFHLLSTDVIHHLYESPILRPCLLFCVSRRLCRQYYFFS